jgi:hypothetical protein
VEVAVCVWVTTTASALPPAAATAYADPAPITNLSRKFGVLLVPSHITHPLGIDAIDPLHIIMPPDGNDAGNAEDAHAVPVLVKTLPDVLGATVATAEVPFPTNTALAVKVDVPVPPFATETIPVAEIAETKIKSAPLHATVAEVPLAMVIPVVGPAPRITTAKPPDVLFTIM